MTSSIPAVRPATARPRAVAAWLIVVAVLIFLIVVVGGITRLTESGLSITEWKPVSGVIPPLTDADWREEFALYQRIPEYQQLNRGMSLDEFKRIFFWEYVHRVLGRMIGLAYALPFAWFALKRMIPSGYGRRLLFILLLGGLQGAIGWWMVASGLTERTDVSHVRLAVHLSVALLIFAAIVWTAADLLSPGALRRRMPAIGAWTLAALAAQIVLGAFVAGLNAGYAFDTWPLMGDEIYPSAAPMLDPFLSNFVDNPIMVQFVHRWWAFVVVGFVVVLARKVRKQARMQSILIHTAVGVQIALGIAVLMTGMPIELAAAHQAVAVLLLATTLTASHSLAVLRSRA